MAIAIAVSDLALMGGWPGDTLRVRRSKQVRLYISEFRRCKMATTRTAACQGWRTVRGVQNKSTNRLTTRMAGLFVLPCYAFIG